MEKALHTLQVPGRIEMLPVSPRFIVIVDYAHNAMALDALLRTLQGLSSGTNHLHFRLRWQPGGRTQIPDGRGGRSAGRSGGGDHG